MAILPLEGAVLSLETGPGETEDLVPTTTRERPFLGSCMRKEPVRKKSLHACDQDSPSAAECTDGSGDVASGGTTLGKETWCDCPQLSQV